jgi:glutamine---fructose-6-phosphate transaminase (isomerizing)
MNRPPRSPLLQQIDSLPGMVAGLVPGLATAVAAALPTELCRRQHSFFLTGCGDSHHAGVAAEMAFQQLAGRPCRALTAMHFARYIAPFLPQISSRQAFVVAVSASGRVSRTVEALHLARQAGATAVALTANRKSPLAHAADIVIDTAVPPLPDRLRGLVVPGVRSYIASQLALYLVAVHVGECCGHLNAVTAMAMRSELLATAGQMAHLARAAEPLAANLVEQWQDAATYLFCGAGPGYGAALFSAAKLLEASGDTAVAQDTEEWAHLQYFERHAATPTFIISNGTWDEVRAAEVATAASAIGRRVAVIAAAGSMLAQAGHHAFLWEADPPLRPCFSPLVAGLPGAIFAAYRAERLAEPYFRSFGGGRSAAGGGGISRIQTSAQWHQLPDQTGPNNRS